MIIVLCELRGLFERFLTNKEQDVGENGIALSETTAYYTRPMMRSGLLFAKMCRPYQKSLRNVTLVRRCEASRDAIFVSALVELELVCLAERGRKNNIVCVKFVTTQREAEWAARLQ